MLIFRSDKNSAHVLVSMFFQPFWIPQLKHAWGKDLILPMTMILVVNIIFIFDSYWIGKEINPNHLQNMRKHRKYQLQIENLNEGHQY